MVLYIGHQFMEPATVMLGWYWLRREKNDHLYTYNWMENDSTKKTLCEGYRLEGQIKTAMENNEG